MKKQFSIPWYKGCRVLLTVLIVLGMLVPSAPRVVRAQEPLDIDFSMVDIPEESKSAFIEAISNRSPEILHGEYFVVTWAEINGDRMLAMIASAGTEECGWEALGIGAHCNTEILLHRVSSSTMLD